MTTIYDQGWQEKKSQKLVNNKIGIKAFMHKTIKKSLTIFRYETC